MTLRPGKNSVTLGEHICTNILSRENSYGFVQDSLNALTDEAMNVPMAEDPDEKDFEDLVNRMGMIEQGRCTPEIQLQILNTVYTYSMNAPYLYSFEIHT